jgi:hypothetical protein
MIDKLHAGAFRATVFQVPTPMGKGVLVSPTVDGTLIVGPTAEEVGDKADTRTTAEGLEKVRQSAARVWPGFPAGGVIATFAGLRAHGDRGDFVLGEPPDAPGFFNAAAVESPGLTAAPALGVWLAEQIKKTINPPPQKLRRASAQRSTFNANCEQIGCVPRDVNADGRRRSRAIPYGRVVFRCKTSPSESGRRSAAVSSPDARRREAAHARAWGAAKEGSARRACEILARSWGLRGASDGFRRGVVVIRPTGDARLATALANHESRVQSQVLEHALQTLSPYHRSGAGLAQRPRPRQRLVKTCCCSSETRRWAVFCSSASTRASAFTCSRRS